jgi:hypothetical protein
VRAKSPKQKGEIQMEKKSFANRFGLIALMMLSLFASTAFAGNAPAPTQVVVTNTPAQPVPMVGLVKDSDAPARKAFQTGMIPVFAGIPKFVVSVPANQRLVIEHISALCFGVVTGYADLFSVDPSTNFDQGEEYLPADMFSKAISTPVRFYAGPGEDLKITFVNIGGQGGSCNMTVSGYFVNLP